MAVEPRDGNGQGVKIAVPPAELQSKWIEIGTPGLDAYSGFITEAYTTELNWPGVYKLYNRIRRSDPEIAIVRGWYTSQARKTEIEVTGPEDPGEDDSRAHDFYQSELENMDGEIDRFMETLVGYVPFLGWAWWEVVPGLRSRDWRPPGGDPWRSQADDGLIGVRRLAWRDHSSFDHWDLDDATGQLRGMWQLDMPNPLVLLPLEASLHITFGDAPNPEGLSPLEAVWRLERIKYGLEVVNGIGFEHAAGYLDVTAEEKLNDGDKAEIRKIARAILTAQEGNYAAWPKGIKGEIKNVDFSAAVTLMDAIRYYGLLKLQLYHMQWVAIASTAGTGAYSAMQDASSMFLIVWNAMLDGFIQQYDEQVGRRLWEWNKDRFPGALDRPRYKAKPMSKIIDLEELGAFLTAIRDTMPLGDEDFIEIRKRSGFLPETLPEPETPMAEPEPAETPEGEEDVAPGAEAAEEQVEDVEDGELQAELAQRPLTVSDDEQPTDVEYLAQIDEDDIARAVSKFERWAEKNEPRLARLLRAKIKEDE